TPRLASWRWRMIFCPARSVASAMRAQSDDRRRTRLADPAAGAIAGVVALGGVLPAAAALGGGSGPDAADRRTAFNRLATRLCDTHLPRNFAHCASKVIAESELQPRCAGIFRQLTLN